MIIWFLRFVITSLYIPPGTGDFDFLSFTVIHWYPPPISHLLLYVLDYSLHNHHWNISLKIGYFEVVWTRSDLFSVFLYFSTLLSVGRTNHKPYLLWSLLKTLFYVKTWKATKGNFFSNWGDTTAYVHLKSVASFLIIYPLNTEYPSSEVTNISTSHCFSIIDSKIYNVNTHLLWVRQTM